MKSNYLSELEVLDYRIMVGYLFFQQIIRGYPQNSNCTVKFCSLIQRIHSPLNCHDGRESMRKVGIYTPEDIGQWIKEVVDNELQQPDLAERLEDFIIKTM